MLKNKILYLDTETTGLIPGYHDVIQIAGILEEYGRVTRRFSYKLRPFYPGRMDQYAQQVNKMVKNAILNFPDPENAICSLFSFLSLYKPGKIIFAGQKTFFDLFFLQALFQKSKYEECRAFNIMHIAHNTTMDLKTLTLLAILQGHKIKSNSLEDVCEYFGVKNEKPHDALSDIHATRECFKKFEVVLKNKNSRWCQR